MDIKEILKNYDISNLTIACLGGHSALEVCEGAKKHGFKTLVIAKKNREKTYKKYFKTRNNPIVNNKIGCVDEVILVNEFSDILEKPMMDLLRSKNTIFIQSRYFWVYFKDFSQIEKNFLVPIFGSRELLRKEERNEEKNQYYLLEKGGIRIPKIFKRPEEIDRLAIVKVNEAQRTYERAFFLASSLEDYQKKADELLKKGMILQNDLKKAVIEEYVVGAQVNFNYFYSPLINELELMGTDFRRQTNLDGYLRLPADEQLELLKISKPKMIETGHITCTTKESLLEKIYDLGEKFVAITKKEFPQGIIGPFALQGAIIAEDGKEDIIIFDVSLRIPGSPGTRFTPVSSYLYGKPLSYGERIALEIKYAIEKGRLTEILS